jgi:hypothetical protein
MFRSKMAIIMCLHSRCYKETEAFIIIIGIGFIVPCTFVWAAAVFCVARVCVCVCVSVSVTYLYKTGMLMDYIHRPVYFYRSRLFGDWLCLRPQVDVAE